MKAKRDESSEIWSLVTGWAKSELRLQNYELWFKPIECRSVLDGQVVLSAPNKFIRDWFETHYSPSVVEMLEKTYNRTFTITWSISEAKEAEADAAAAAAPVERRTPALRKRQRPPLLVGRSVTGLRSHAAPAAPDRGRAAPRRGRRCLRA